MGRKAAAAATAAHVAKLPQRLLHHRRDGVIPHLAEVVQPACGDIHHAITWVGRPAGLAGCRRLQVFRRRRALCHEQSHLVRRQGEPQQLSRAPHSKVWHLRDGEAALHKSLVLRSCVHSFLCQRQPTFMPTATTAGVSATTAAGKVRVMC